MARVLVISPSGEVYNKNCVRWYHSLRFSQQPEHYHNIGDAFVYDSSLKLLDFSHLEAINIRDATSVDIDRYNSEFDYAFLRGSNYLHSEMDWENAPDILSRLRIPIIAFGIGAQAPSKRKLELNSSARRVMAKIADSSESLGVRGAYTADVLWSIGIKNVRIVACPTVFRKNNPNLSIKLPSLCDVKQVAYTLRREVDQAYAQDLCRYLTIQRETIADLAQKFDLDVVAQGELEEKNILWGDLQQRELAISKLRKQDWLRGENDIIERLYKTNLFYSDNVSEFESKIAGKDLVLGYRLHGNLLGLANQVPAIYFTYDSRTSEFAETLQIPHFDVFSTERFEIEKFWDQSLFDKFNRAYYQTYRAMRLFLNENRVPNLMKNDVIPANIIHASAA